MSILSMLLRIIITILVLLVMARLNGPKQISQMNFYDYIVGITVGSLAASVSIDSSVGILNGTVAIVIYLLSGFFMSWLARKNMACRRFLSGKPIVLIARGEIQWNGLKRARMNINELLCSLRYSGYYNISEVDYAVLEPTGKLSVKAKGFARPAKISDLNVTVPAESLFADVIIDGSILLENLQVFQKDEQWLRQQLNQQGIYTVEEVGLAVLNDQGALSVFRKDQHQTAHTSFN